MKMKFSSTLMLWMCCSTDFERKQHNTITTHACDRCVWECPLKLLGIKSRSARLLLRYGVGVSKQCSISHNTSDNDRYDKIIDVSGSCLYTECRLYTFFWVIWENAVSNNLVQYKWSQLKLHWAFFSLSGKWWPEQPEICMKKSEIWHSMLTKNSE